MIPLLTWVLGFSARAKDDSWVRPTGRVLSARIGPAAVQGPKHARLLAAYCGARAQARLLVAYRQRSPFVGPLWAALPGILGQARWRALHRGP